jgi:hypothetical protein
MAAQQGGVSDDGKVQPVPVSAGREVGDCEGHLAVTFLLGINT